VKVILLFSSQKLSIDYTTRLYIRKSMAIRYL